MWVPDLMEDLALTYTMVGEHEKAIEQLALQMSIPAEQSAPLLDLDSRWDPLREYRELQDLLEKCG